MNKINIIRQGDILLKAVQEPTNLKSLGKFNSYVIAEGEQTGHKHLLTAEPATQFEILEDEKEQRYLKMFSKGKLTHEEHRQVDIMPNFYVIGNEREFDYFLEEIKQVQD